ncbi:IS66 family insertion sequence element accessory protein TnpB [bacterium]|nr:IS66 family insertion sequence element accessory protein TnpB [bacterium]
MLQLTPQMKILVAVEPVDGRKGIDGLAQVCREKLAEDPFSGCVFLFRTRKGTSIKILVYDGQGYFYAQKRLSQGSFRFWPIGADSSFSLQPHQAQMLLAAGSPWVKAAPVWRAVRAESRQVPA